MTPIVLKKHYIGNIDISKFYYKNDIFTFYNMHLFIDFLPIEIINKILSYICTSLVVFATNKTIHYINPKDNATIKSIQLNKIRNLNSYNNTFAISADGLTFYRIYRRHIELEYLSEEAPDYNKPPNKKTITNRYYYSYNIAKKCKISTPIYPYGPIYGKYGDVVCVSSNGKYIVTCASKENVINNSGAYIAIYDAKTKTLVKEIKFYAKDILSLSLSPDNNMIMAITSRIEDKHTVWIWNIKTGENILEKKLDSNMYYDPIDHKIVWNNISNRFAITFILNNNINEQNIGSGIVFGTLTNIFINTFPDQFIDNITWIENKQIIFNIGKEVLINIVGKDIYNTVTIPIEYHLRDFKSSIDGDLIIKYKKLMYITNPQIIEESIVEETNDNTSINIESNESNDWILEEADDYDNTYNVEIISSKKLYLSNL